MSATRQSVDSSRSGDQPRPARRFVSRLAGTREGRQLELRVSRPDYRVGRSGPRGAVMLDNKNGGRGEVIARAFERRPV